MVAKEEPIQYPLRVEADGEFFLIEPDPQQAGVYHYDWLSGPHSYGFTTGFATFDELSGRTTQDHEPTLTEHLEGIRSFVNQIDPETGFIDDD